ncbi:DUF4097 domain-containing protein [Brevibacillus humidisoli]|uniref:DUF4097 family beta strand repeat-containing protein n=1 Tax=Brevibacillus humidisoli TaxID=2895522 RepID=UPI001E65B2E7|nr:DUF4097 family beta strand repeat-containing protein [Brevibacillus humidisoli]UFJ39657.1 DUF4097 domain-containing protein [Brevibacillus humidisoli]
MKLFSIDSHKLNEVFKVAFFVFLIGIAGSVYQYTKNQGAIFATVPIEQQQVVAGKNIQNIVVNGNTVDLNLMPGDSDQFIIQLHGNVSKHLQDDYELKVDTSNHSLNVSTNQKDQMFMIGFHVSDVRLDITVPQKMYERLTVDTATGDIAVQQLQAKHCVLSSDIGDITVRHLQGSELSLDTDTGSIDLRDFGSGDVAASTNVGDVSLQGISGKVTVDTETGDVDLQMAEVQGEITVETDTGDVEVDISDLPAALQVDLSASVGDTTVDLPGMSYRTNTDHGVKGEIGTGGPLLKVTSEIGDITVRNQ